MSNKCLCLGLALAAVSILPPAAAQDYPVREIRSICNFTAGSGADIIVRYYSDKLSKLAGKPVIVENRAGAQGLVATDYVAKAKPDGYTILITPASSTLATAPHIFKQVPFDPLKDFAPVTTLNSLAFTIVVDAAKPYRTIDDLLAALREKRDNGFYGTQSNSGQVTGELLKQMRGLKTVYVPYKATGDALASLLGGDVDFLTVDATWASTMHPHKIRILAVTSAKRSGALPDIPTMAEQGFKDFDITPWWGVVVPAGTPRPIVERLAAWFNQINGTDDTKQFLARAALDIFPGSPESMAALLKTEIARWKGFVELAKIE
ncbi:MAG TPA: tripartite tricarboxylate transporter substrate binding protein, partial [Burkholderiales bacterium]|nr:tripartite tricarboxylate transporter substrate binding protein [Burkholderiales bacterium]